MFHFTFTAYLHEANLNFTSIFLVVVLFPFDALTDLGQLK